MTAKPTTHPAYLRDYHPAYLRDYLPDYLRDYLPAYLCDYLRDYLPAYLRDSQWSSDQWFYYTVMNCLRIKTKVVCEVGHGTTSSLSPADT